LGLPKTTIYYHIRKFKKLGMTDWTWTLSIFRSGLMLPDMRARLCTPIWIPWRSSSLPHGPQWCRTTSWPHARSSGYVLRLWSTQEAPILKAEMYWQTFIIIFFLENKYFIALWPIRTTFIFCSTLFSAYGTVE
jgi:hypothetical protein